MTIFLAVSFYHPIQTIFIFQVANKNVKNILSVDI